MNIHEYQAKDLLRFYGCYVPNGALINSKDSVNSDIAKLSGNKLVVKAQVHAGGRGKAGGIKVVDRSETASTVAKMLGMQLVTLQTGGKPKVVNKIYVEEASNIQKEYYLSLVLDRNKSSLLFIASEEGGMDIEELAHNSPEKIIKVWVPGYQEKLPEFSMRKLLFGLNIPKESASSFAKAVHGIYQLMIQKDAMQIEINPLILNDKGEFMILDAKISFDESALYRHPDIASLQDLSETDALENEAKKYDLSYVKLDGNIGCMVNGAGLAMATMDVIKIHGGEPANFLDVGGGATVERITEAFAILLSDKDVKGILVNIFGGIVRCDVIASGILEAAKKCEINIPVVVRLDGTNVKEGKALLASSGLKIYSADNLDEAAILIIKHVS